MNNYLIIAAAWFIGQIAYASVSAYIIQKDLTGIDYWQALRVYAKKETGSFVMAFSALLVMLFIFPDFFDPSVTRADLLNKEALTIKERMIAYLRTSSLIAGGLSQHILYVAFKRGKKAIVDYAAKNNVDSNVA
jgi:cbb3-type cytochrome oxidase subunit 3